MREKLIEILRKTRYEYRRYIGMKDMEKRMAKTEEEFCAIDDSIVGEIPFCADHLIANGVTILDNRGCDYCQEDAEGYRKMNGAFSITNPFHAGVWQLETAHCKPRQIFFCPMCGRKLARKG